MEGDKVDFDKIIPLDQQLKILNDLGIITIREFEILFLQVKFDINIYPSDIKVFKNDNLITKENDFIKLKYDSDNNFFSITIQESLSNRDEGIYKIFTPNSEYKCKVIVEKRPLRFIAELQDVKLTILPDFFYRLIQSLDNENKLLNLFKPEAEFEIELSTGYKNIFWMINNDDPVENSQNIQIGSSSDFKKHFLILKNCKVDHSGQKIKFSLNNANTVKQANLLVEEVSRDFLIKIRKPLEDNSIKERENGAFSCGIQINSNLNQINLPIEIKWFKNNFEIFESEKHVIEQDSDKNLKNYKLTIKNCSLEDSTNYSCKIYLRLKEEYYLFKELNAKLFVKEIQPEILKPLPSCMEVILGEPIVLKCQISKPCLQVTWLKDNIQIGSKYETNINQIENQNYSYEFIIKNSEIKNSGRYKLIYNHLQTECKVIVKKPKIEILKPLENMIYVIKNQTAVLETHFSDLIDNDMFYFEFYKNLKRIYFSNKSPKYQMIINKNELKFLIKDFDSDEEDKYEIKLCTLNNEYHIVQQTECKCVLDDLKIVQHLSDLEIIEFSRAEFLIRASGPCECEWYLAKSKNDLENFLDRPEETIEKLKPIHSNNRIIKKSYPDNSFSLTIDKTKKTESGVYVAILKPNLIYSSSQLTVNLFDQNKNESKEPVIIEDLSSQVEGIVNEPFSLIIKVKGENIQFEWFNGKKKVIPLTDQVELIKKDELTFEIIFNFKNPFSCDSGDYYCRIWNDYGVTKSNLSHVLIKDPNIEQIELNDSIFQTKPRFIEYFSDVYVEEHAEAQFKCKIIGNPEPKVVWYCNCRKIVSDEKFECIKDSDHYILIVRDIGSNDEGEYSCKASNCKGENSWAANLYLNESFGKKHIDSSDNFVAPNFLRKIKDSTVLEGNTAKLDCFIDGEPFPNVKFYKNNSLIEIERQQQKYNLVVDELTGNVCLMINDCNKKDQDEYAAVIENSAGKSQCSAFLSVEIVNENGKNKNSHKRKVRFSLPKDSDVFIIPSNEIEAPEPPSNVKITEYKTNSLTLGWLASPSESSSVCTYIVEFRSSKSYAWSVYSSNIDSLSCIISYLTPGLNYSFRIRTENLYGISIPSQIVSTKNLIDKTNSNLLNLNSNKLDIDQFVDSDNKKFDKSNNRPKIHAKEKDVRFYVEGQTASISIPVYGNPRPNVMWKHKGVELINDNDVNCVHKMYRDKYGDHVLEIENASEKNEGMYEIFALNEYGQASHVFYLQQADPPIFLEPFKDVTIKNYEDLCITCKVDGIPYPEVKFYKDWRLMTESHRIRIEHVEPDTWTVRIKASIQRDSGLYTCTAKNIAGATLCSSNVNVVDSVLNVPHPDLKTDLVVFKCKKFDQDYEIVEKINQSLNSTIYRVIERQTAKEFIAKMVNRSEYSEWIKSESDCLNQIHQVNECKFVRLHDAYQVPNSNNNIYILVFDECKGKNLIELSAISNDSYLDEKKIALYIKELLELLNILHSRNIVHLDIKPDNILVDLTSKKLKLIGFTHSKCLRPDMSSNDTNELVYHDYGDVEFVAPEIVNRLPITLNTDMWSVGVLTYVLLCGKSPFYAKDNSRLTLENVGNCVWNFGDEAAEVLTHEAKDFVQRLLVKNPNERMSVTQALNHPWIHFSSQKLAQSSIVQNVQSSNSNKINKQNIIELHSRYLWSKHQKSTQPWIKQMQISKIFNQSINETDNETSNQTRLSDNIQLFNFVNDNQITMFEYEEINNNSNNNINDIYDHDDEYLNPGSYLLPVKDPLFTVRLREYQRTRFQKVKQIENFLKSTKIDNNKYLTKNTHNNNNNNRKILTNVTQFDYQANRPLKERYHVDIYGRCIKRGSLSRSVLAKSSSRSSVSPSSTNGRRSQSTNSICDYLDSRYDSRLVNGEGSAPIIRQKLKDMFLLVGSLVTFRCRIEGNPSPKCFWYHNDRLIIGDDDRFKFSQSEDGISTLTICKARINDIGVYRCSAHNQYGTAITNARLTVGDTPDKPSRPIVSQYSSDQVFLIWEAPFFDGNSHILCYKVDFKIVDDVKWSNALYTIQECCLIRNLQPQTKYIFRVSCINTIGVSSYSWASEQIETLALGQSKITIDQDKIESLLKDQYILDKKSEQKILLRKFNESDYDCDSKCLKTANDEHFKIQSNLNPIDLYEYSDNLIVQSNSQIKFFTVIDRANKVKKLLKITNKLNLNEIKILKEFKVQDRLNSLLEAFEYTENDTLQYALVYTHATPILDFITYRHKYSEELVIKILRQLLDAVEWIHLHGFLHLNIHPLTILNSNMTQVNVKLSGFDNLVKLNDANYKIDDSVSFEQFNFPLEFICKLFFIYYIYIFFLFFLSFKLPKCLTKKT